MTVTAAPGSTVTTAKPREVQRYTMFERLVHWGVALTFVYLLLSGMALAYPRLAWLMTWLGGGQTVRAAHPWVGVVFTIGMVLMVLMWTRSMRFDATDREWVRRLRTYMRTGHTGLDIGKYNAGQKGYHWSNVVFSAILLITGVPLWYPWILGADSGWQQAARLVHHASYLAILVGFIIHVYLSSVMLPGTMSAMTSGKVTRRWAAWHHPRWLREKEGAAE